MEPHPSRPLPTGARAFLTLTADGAAHEQDQRSLPRTLGVLFVAALLTVGVPLGFAGSAAGAEVDAPLAIKSDGGGDDEDARDEDGEGDGTSDGAQTGSHSTTSGRSGVTTKSQTGSLRTAHATTAAADNDSSQNSTTSNRAATTHTKTSTGGGVNATGADDSQASTTSGSGGTTRTRTTTGRR